MRRNIFIYIFVFGFTVAAFGAVGVFSNHYASANFVAENENLEAPPEKLIVAGDEDGAGLSEINEISENSGEESVFTEPETVAGDATGTETLSTEPLSENSFLNDFVDKYIKIALSEDRDPQQEDGYTKYGKYFGNAYAQWCTEFAMWCILEADKELGTDYAEEYFPCKDSAYSCVKWHEKNGTLRLKQNYIPRKGDIIYFDYDEDESCDHTGLVTGVEKDPSNGLIYILTVEGNLPEDYPNGVIRERRLAADSRIIYGYGTFDA